jgi:ComF family protein
MAGLTFLETLLGPPPCEGCGRHLGALCPRCRARLGSPTVSIPLHGVDRVLAHWAYEGAARSLILGLKLRGARSAARPLVAAMRAEVLARGLLGDAITWVPGRRRDVRRRGYDHAEVLGRGLAAALGLPATPLLRRIGDRADQTTLGGAERRTNLQGACAARPCSAGIVVVDDLITTGATAEACAEALRAGGAATVEVVVPCRA